MLQYDHQRETERKRDSKNKKTKEDLFNEEEITQSLSSSYNDWFYGRYNNCICRGRTGGCFRAGYLISYGNNKTKFGQKGFLLGSSSRAGS